MEKLAVCRMCLADDVPMRLMANKYLQAMFEKMTEIPFVREDRPVLVCYICCARLHSSYKLTKSCLRSEELFQQMLNTDELTPNKLEQLTSTEMFGIMHVLHLSYSGEHNETLISSGDSNDVQLSHSGEFGNTGEQTVIDDGEMKQELEAEVQYRKIVGTNASASIVLHDHNYFGERPGRTSPQFLAVNSESLEHQGSLADVIQQSHTHSDVIQHSHTHMTASYDIQIAVKTESCEEQRLEGDDVISSDTDHDPLCNYECSNLIPLIKDQIVLPRCDESTSGQWKSGRAPQSDKCEDVSNKLQNIDETNIKAKNTSSERLVCNEMRVLKQLFHCQHCEKLYYDRNNFLHHIRSHFDARPFECDICKKRFSLKSNLVRHIRIHTDKKPYEYDVCKKSSRAKKSLEDRCHNIHTGKRIYECAVCKKCFYQKYDILVHFRKHTGAKPVSKETLCDVCGKCFNHSSTLATHARTHTGEKPFECDICKKRYRQKVDLDRHARTHTGEKPFECNVCKKSFYRNFDLVVHSRTHTGVKPYECDVCKKSFSSKGTLVSHTRTHTGEKRFKCSLCKKRFSYKQSLKKHACTHTDVKPYECDICKKCFRHKEYLIIHIRTHTGEKPFKCLVCTKSFISNSVLQRHGRTHTVQKPFKCLGCRQRFTSELSLKRHARAHTGENRLNLMNDKGFRSSAI